MFKYPVPGDIVYLRSGGLEMVVSEVQGGFANCVWHDKHGTAQSASPVEIPKSMSPVPEAAETCEMRGWAVKAQSEKTLTYLP